MQPNKQQANINFRHDEEGNLLIRSSGQWSVTALNDVAKRLEKYSRRVRNIPVHWDVAQISSLDSAGMMLLKHYMELFRSRNCQVEVSGFTAEQGNLYRMVSSYSSHAPSVAAAHKPRFLQPFNSLGKLAMSFWDDMAAFLSFVGEDFVVLVLMLLQPWKIRFGAIVKNIQEAGVRALPIIALTSFLIGVVIAYQGAVQLQKFGANAFIVDMIAISVTRELAPLITAIVVAGRTGSSYTAQIGVMKITQEIDAMRTMGFEPHLFLVLPRIIAVMIALPLLIFFADIVGICGGMVVANLHLQLSWTEFMHRLQDVLEVKHVWIGLAKGPFFAWLIAITGCFRGFQVSRNTESIGRYTTISVVNAIFLVIACDALFSVILTELGI